MNTNPDSEIDELVVWTLPCDDCGEVGCPYLWGEDRKDLYERIKALKHQWQLELREQLLSEVKGLELTDYDDTDPYQKERIKTLTKQQEGK